MDRSSTATGPLERWHMLTSHRNLLWSGGRKGLLEHGHLAGSESPAWLQQRKGSGAAEAQLHQAVMAAQFPAQGWRIDPHLVSLRRVSESMQLEQKRKEKKVKLVPRTRTCPFFPTRKPRMQIPWASPNPVFIVISSSSRCQALSLALKTWSPSLLSGVY